MGKLKDWLDDGRAVFSAFRGMSPRALRILISMMILLSAAVVVWFTSIAPWIRSQMIPPGTVVARMSDGPVPAGWLVCDHSEQKSSKYPDLALILNGGKDMEKFFLPDLRGMFLRGVGMNDEDAYKYPGSDSRKVGSPQSDSFRRHRHSRKVDSKSTPEDVYMVYEAGNTSSENVVLARVGEYGNGKGAEGVLNVEQGGDETRPMNIGVVWIIKY
jgi:hypothetical protein